MYEKRTVTEVARNFASYVNRAYYGGERFMLIRGNKPVAEIGPVPRGGRLGDLPALLASLPRLSEEDATLFEEDVADLRTRLAEAELGDPWES